MINTLKKIRHRLLQLVGSQNLEKIVVSVSRALNVDLLLAAHHKKGISKCWDDDASGESYVINSVLKSYLLGSKVTFFDVGANVGSYSKMLNQAFPDSKIYAFEPNLNTFKVLKEQFSRADVKTFCIGLSSCASKTKIYTYASDNQSQHASIYKEVLSDLHKADQVIGIDFETDSIDNFCEQHNIKEIDFLKIDTEGHEFEVMSGAKKMIMQGSIKIIQFEFNEMNIISRVFLKDFYHMLNDYNIYRVDSDRLLPLFEYDSRNEIFQFQNFLAVNKSIV